MNFFCNTITVYAYKVLVADCITALIYTVYSKYLQFCSYNSKSGKMKSISHNQKDMYKKLGVCRLFEACVDGPNTRVQVAHML